MLGPPATCAAEQRAHKAAGDHAGNGARYRRTERLLDRYTNSENHMWAETLLPKVADEELERLVSVAMAVINEESKG